MGNEVETSPLANSEEIRETSISDLFGKKASEITDEEVDACIAFLVERREVWEMEEVSKRRGGRRPRISKGTSEKKQGKVKLALDELDIDLD